MEPFFFPDPTTFRNWLGEHHRAVDELWVGFFKKATGKPSMTWPESVDQALCFGWIDGLRRSVDEERYTIRFTPRRAGSIWSAVNRQRLVELIDAGLVHPAGLAVFEARDPAKEQRYSFEQMQVAFAAEQQETFQQHAGAWAFFESQPPGYRKQATWWVVSAKREETRARRLATLIADSTAGMRIKPLRR